MKLPREVELIDRESLVTALALLDIADATYCAVRDLIMNQPTAAIARFKCEIEIMEE